MTCSSPGILALLILTCVAGCANRTEQDVGDTIFGGGDSFGTVTEGSTAAVSLIDGTPAMRADGIPDISEFPVIREIGKLTGEQFTSLVAALSDADSYIWDSSKGCLVTPGVKLTFGAGDSQVDILFCFECDVLMVYRNGKYSAGGSFDFGRAAIVEALRQAFPDDAAIQKLIP